MVAVIAAQKAGNINREGGITTFRRLCYREQINRRQSRSTRELESKMCELDMPKQVNIFIPSPGA
jgi:hypothetical protein